MKKVEKPVYKTGTVALVGRPNAGKSTILNAIIGNKVSITSPKPQTTQFSVQAVYEDPQRRGQIIFTDTPGIFAKTDNPKAHEVNMTAEHSIKDGVDAIVYIVDRSRERGVEENKVLGLVRKLDVPKILVINKTDIREPDFTEQYKFMEEEFDATIELSGRTHRNLNILIDTIFEFLKEGEPTIDTEGLATAALNIDSKLYLEELIREKAFLRLRREVPYSVQIIVDDIVEKPQKKMTVISARIVAPARYKKMIIGAGGTKIKEIGMMARRELEIATGRKIYLELFVQEV